MPNTQAESEQLRDLEIMAIGMFIPVTQAIQASIVMGAAGILFNAEKRAFRTNPANTLTYSSLRAVEERAVVRVTESIKISTKVFPVDSEIRRLDDLWSHRTLLSHPATREWTSEHMKAFMKAKRDVYDLRPALLWDMQQSINEAIVALGGEPSLTEIPVTQEMAILLSAVFRCSASEAQLLQLLKEQELFSGLHGFRDRYMAFLEERARDE